jgi:hypothetical protein
MDLALLLGILIGVPILVVGSIQCLIYKVAGAVPLRVVCAVVASYCAFALTAAYDAPPILGNKAGYVAAADGITAIVMLECVAILLWPLGRRFFSWLSAPVRG